MSNDLINNNKAYYYLEAIYLSSPNFSNDFIQTFEYKLSKILAVWISIDEAIAKDYAKYNNDDPRPLNGDVYCSECGFKLSGYVRRKKVKTTGKVNEIHYYKCFKCGAVHINANSTKYSKSEGLHNQFLEILAYFIIDKKVHQPISIQLKKLINTQNKEITKLNSAAKKKITELKTELETIELRFATGKIPEKLYDKFTKQLSKEIFDLEQELSGDGNATSNPRLKFVSSYNHNILRQLQSKEKGDYQCKN